MLGPKALAKLRGTLEKNMLPDTCTIRKVTITKTGRGTTKTYTDFATLVKCHVEPIPVRNMETLVAEKVLGVSQYTIRIPWDQEIENDWRIAVDGGDTYEVTAPLDRGKWTIVRSVLCVKVGGDD